MVVLAIMGLVAILAPPILQGARHKILVRSEIFHLADQLKAAHQQSIDTESTVRFAIPSQPTVIFFPDGSATPVVIHTEGATISVAPFSGRVDVSF